ncbi:DUF2937 family protein [Paracoccus marinaquae]|uniref:DUF2937 family protein n=1 Tax=Paracoccus marinaquae TaxID=2841926 RepID=A0ABS6AQA8_9RHOB|nr:DUF2937 family protein [Paracoccus marinaquae]MBU3031810.1 DUF2937 family protein [Paracoccus marinaquae]
MTGLLRMLVAIVFAAAFSQFPAFSDQYVQRLGGQLDALSLMAQEFDASAARAGLSRDAALADLTGSDFRAAHQADLRAQFARLDRARADYQTLRLAGPLERMLLPHRLRDAETLAATWGDFRPAIPVTVAGLVAAAFGFVLGWAVLMLLALPFRQPREPLGWR